MAASFVIEMVQGGGVIVVWGNLSIVADHVRVSIF